MKLTNKNGYKLVLVIGAVALCAFLAVINKITTQADANKELAKPEVKTEGEYKELTKEDKSEIIAEVGVSTFLIKADAYLKEAEIEYKKAKDSGFIPVETYMTAIYLRSKAISTQNQAMIEQNKMIIELLREKTGK